MDNVNLLGRRRSLASCGSCTTDYVGRYIAGQPLQDPSLMEARGSHLGRYKYHYLSLGAGGRALCIIGSIPNPD